MSLKGLWIIAAVLLLCGCGGNGSQARRGVYHWKTTYNPTEWEMRWMKDHKVDKMYVKLFDVEAGTKDSKPDWKMVPVATTQFKQKLPSDMEVVPVVYITVDATRALGEESWDWEDKKLYAKLIVKRVEAMMAEHYEGTIHEVQLDCDWTQQTRLAYFMLAKEVKNLLHERDITLSGTLRLHQLCEAEPQPEAEYYHAYDSLPFDRSLLMCYNTGRLQEWDTRNSILDFDDVKPYLRQYHLDTLPRTDVAYPVYGWGVEFDGDGRFVKIINSHNLSKEKGGRIREEWGEPQEINRTQRALPMLDSDHTTILYHLDSLNLSRYSYEEIEEFYSR